MQSNRSKLRTSIHGYYVLAVLSALLLISIILFRKLVYDLRIVLVPIATGMWLLSLMASAYRRNDILNRMEQDTRKLEPSRKTWLVVLAGLILLAIGIHPLLPTGWRVLTLAPAQILLQCAALWNHKKYRIYIANQKEAAVK